MLAVILYHCNTLVDCIHTPPSWLFILLYHIVLADPLFQPISTCKNYLHWLYYIGMSQSGGNYAATSISLSAKTNIYCTYSYYYHVGSLHRIAIIPANLPAIARSNPVG